MLPTIASGSGGQKNRISRRAPRVADVRRLDAALFASSGWFAIDARNQRVPGVVVASLAAGLELVGRGSVATIVGRLRCEVVVVDVDLAGEPGWAVTESLSQWCAREGLWHLVRPSGGAEGRCHVFIAPQARREALEAFLDGLRRSNPGARTSIDLRTSVRPLSAPHRTGAHTHPFEADVALSRLEAQPWHTAPAPRRAKSKPTKRRRPPVAALEPTRRREHRPLPVAWQHFLDTGERPPLREPAPGASAHTRSTWEAIATASMVRAGWSAQQAWEAIQKAHPHAMDHARADRRRWVQWVWNRAVLDDADYQPPRSPLDPHMAAAVDQARTRLRTIGWSLPLRRRHAVLLVGHALLDRMARTGLLRVPLVTEPYVAVLPRDHPMADLPGIDLAMLGGDTWIDNEPVTGRCRRRLLRACAAAGFAPTYGVQTQDHMTAIAFVAASVGITVVPRLCTKGLRDGVVAVPVHNPTPTRTVTALVNRSVERSGPVELALAELRRCAAEEAGLTDDRAELLD